MNRFTDGLKSCVRALSVGLGLSEKEKEKENERGRVQEMLIGHSRFAADAMACVPLSLVTCHIHALLIYRKG